MSLNFKRKAVALGVAMAIASSAYANPNGLSVVAGQATAQTIGNLLQITNTPGAILNWQQFNIDVGQTTQFIQQNAASQVFNRVTGGDVSQILGTLQSNGQVFLINPAGVFFGQGAVIDTAGFLASTLAASNTDLLNGHLRFNDENGTAGSIVNQGKLTTHSGGSIVLLAPDIENSGVIHADGEVLLAAGHSVTIVDMKHPTIGLTVTVKEGDEAINLGKVVGTNASVFASLVKHSGVTEATGAEVGDGGVIRFIAKGDALVGGRVLAESTSGQGGEIDITGKRVAVLDGAHISADGATGGGTLHIGGGWKGQDDSIANAQQTVVQANTHVSANATLNGNGGEVVAWSDGHTRVDSEIQAKGGVQGGNGGRVETSGKQSLSANVAANTSAQHGDAGQWLIDPANLTIVDEIPLGGFNLGFTSNGPFYSTDDISPTFSPTESFLLNSTVVSGLENNGFVEIYTSGTRPGDGNLTVAAPILVDSNFSDTNGLKPELLLEAKGKIDIQAAIGLQPGQTALEGFDLVLSYDIAKPVYVDAPLYLGGTGSLVLSPYEVAGGSQLPENTAGQLPLDGVNFLSGMNTDGSTEPFVLNKVEVKDAIAVDFSNEATLFVGPDKPVKLNVLGANLRVNTISNTASDSAVETDVIVGAGSSLQYNALSARSLTVDAGATVSTYAHMPQGQTFESSPSTSLERLSSSGTVALNGGFSSIGELEANAGVVNFSSNPGSSFSSFSFPQVGTITADAGSTINVMGSSLQYSKATLNGTVNVMADSSGNNAFVNGIDTDLNGTFNLAPGFNNSASFQALGMGASSVLNIGSGGYVQLGRASSSSSSMGGAPVVPPKQPDAYISSTNGQFVALEGARIVMNGASSPDVEIPSGFLAAAASDSTGFGGATLDVTGLDGRLDAPVTIESNAYLNSIQTESENFGFSFGSGTPTQIDTLVIDSASIVVNADGNGEALRIGPVQFSDSPSVNEPLTVNLDFNGNLQVNGGNVRLEGANVSTTDGVLNVDGANGRITLAGEFTSADLNAVNRSNGGSLAAEGFWDNSAVTAANAATVSPLAKGNILVSDDLTIAGGLLSNAGTTNALDVAPGSALELRNIEVTNTINLASASSLILAAQDQAGNAVAPVVLSDAQINMGGDALLIVESDASGVANLDGFATISSGTQGNLLLAGRRVFDSSAASLAPDAMTLNVGSGIRLNVTGNAASTADGLAFYYSSRGITAPPQRPVFLVGQLTPEAVAVAEYNDFGGFSTPVGTVLSGFEGPSFVIDGIPDPSSGGVLACESQGFCVKFDVAQTVNYAGSLTSILGGEEPTLANSGVAFVAGTNLADIKFSVQTADSIRFIQGLNILTLADLASGKTLINGAGSTVRLGSNQGNETIANNLQNNGVLEFQGNYTLSGLLSGTGIVNNTGTLVFSNGTGSLLTNSIVNTGVISNAGTYSLAGVLSGTGSFTNSGTLNLMGSGLFANAISNSGTGVLSFLGGPSQNIQFGSSFNNASNVLFGGGSYSFNNGYNQTAGDVTVQPGTQLTGNVNINGGALRGMATINGNLNVQNASLIPGASPGLMTVNGNLVLTSTSVTDIEIQSNGGMPGTDFDCIVVNGNATLDGQLNLIDISGNTLGAGHQYAFLEATTITGAFANITNSMTGTTYAFAPPEINSVNNIQQLITSTVAINTPPPPVPPTIPSLIITGNTGSTDSSVSQNLNQAFVPPTANTTPSDDSNPSAQQMGAAVEVANQSTVGTTVSEQTRNIELRSIPSDPQRAAAVCK